MIGLINNPTNTEEWTHSLFESPVFVLETYREKLEQLLLNTHDWDNEPTSTKNDMIQRFGASNWKQKVAEYMSWSGLEETPEFTTWANTQSQYVPSTFEESMPGYNINEEFCISINFYWTNPLYINDVLNTCN